jgi:hypothetical protein
MNRYDLCMGWIETRAQWLNLWSALIQRTWAFLDAIGVTTQIKALFLLIAAGVWAMISWLVGHLPWWATTAIALGLASLTTRLLTDLWRAWAVIGIKKLSLETAADACEKYEQRYWDFITGHQQEIEAAVSHRYCDGASIMAEFEKAQKAEEIIMTKMRERLGSEVGALIAMLSSLNIQADSDFRSLHWSNGPARYYGAIGKLLRCGLLEEAQKLDRHRLIF